MTICNFEFSLTHLHRTNQCLCCFETSLDRQSSSHNMGHPYNWEFEKSTIMANYRLVKSDLMTIYNFEFLLTHLHRTNQCLCCFETSLDRQSSSHNMGHPYNWEFEKSTIMANYRLDHH